MHWDFFSDLAYRRSKIIDKLRDALREAAGRDFVFHGYQRVVAYRYSREPLAVEGSLLEPGGRFNIGDIDRRFPVFPALYMGEDKATAMQEVLCTPTGKGDGKTDLDYALTNPESVLVVSVSGRLESVIDLSKPDRLARFLGLIKDFDVPKGVLRTASKHKIPLDVVRSVDGLTRAILNPNWREWPMLFDVPASPQIFGQLVMDAGIEGIVYPSRYGAKTCLAVYPQNFRETGSYVELDHQPPVPLRWRKLDSSTWHEVACAEVPVASAGELRTLLPGSAVQELMVRIRSLRVVRWLLGGRSDN